ncbi:MAG: NYN domain-containing protein [candidate division KSB1 bacterium]|nr:NYN domain-containing protein [candidate division KSB1 bacterium]MDZ7318769.1 NYN domain-containing protein [candidate division KSB1 bacterium]MDZ7339854.1 NYN domain-containing protein [candidate division KSB1 bacterium]
MTPQYLLDGYNVIYQVPQFLTALEQSLEQGRNALIHFVRSYQAGKRLQMIIVFDGDQVAYSNSPELTVKGLSILFSQPPEKADPLIKRLIQRNPNKRSLILVSSDQELVQFARQQGVGSISPMEFYERGSHPPANQTEMDQKYEAEVSEADMTEWLKLFGE